LLYEIQLLNFAAIVLYTESMTTRSYNQYCGLAYALDIVGERWTLLILRELQAGPRRFKDLMDGLPGISTNLLAERLKTLEQQGMLVRRVLPPPAGSAVYVLTPLARGLEKALLELGKWGSQFVPPSWEGAHLLHLGSYALTPKTFFRAEEARGICETYELHIDNETLQMHVNDGEFIVRQGDALPADAVFHTDMPAYLRLLAGQITAEDAIATGLVRVEGDPAALGRFIRLCGLPGAAARSCAEQTTVSS
jgi:DNA-binding HxlR family transcriptional regulator